MDDREFNFVRRDPLTESLHQERVNRESNALWQCDCEIGMPFLKPCGQQLRLLNGTQQRTVFGTSAHVQLLPLDLMDETQKEIYTRIEGVDCWWCGHPFNGNPVGCPVKMVKIRKRLQDPIMHKRKAWCNEPRADPTTGICTRCKHRHKNAKPAAIRKGKKYRGRVLQKLLSERARRDHIWTEQYTSQGITSSEMRLSVQYYKYVPQTHELVDGFYMKGYFCSWACARAYGEVHHPRLRNDIGCWIYKFLIGFIKVLKQQDQEDRDKGRAPRHGIPLDYKAKPIRAAPHFCVLKSRGGTKTIDEFRRANELDNERQLTVIDPSMNVIPRGMLATDMPLQHSFRVRYNEYMGHGMRRCHKQKLTNSLAVQRVNQRKSAIHQSIKD